MKPSKKVRVLFIIHSFSGGGAERVLSHILNALSREYFDISVLTFSDKKDYNIPEDIKYVTFNKKGRLDWFFIIKKLITLLRSYQFDVVVSFLTHVNIVVITSWLLSGKESTLIVSERSNPKEHLKYQKFGRVKKRLLSVLYPLADLILCASKGIKNVLSSEFKVPFEKIQVIYNPLDIKKIDILKVEKVDHPWFSGIATPVVLACGRLTPEKNYHLLIMAFKKLLSKGISAKLVILG